MNINKEEIEAFLKSDLEEISIDFSEGWGSIQKVLTPLGYKELESDDFEDATNGWDVDFWYYWTHDSLQGLMVSGSLHRGDFKLNKANKGE